MSESLPLSRSAVATVQLKRVLQTWLRKDGLLLKGEHALGYITLLTPRKQTSTDLLKGNRLCKVSRMHSQAEPATVAGFKAQV